MSDVDIISAFVKSFQFDQFFTHENPPPDELNAGIDPSDWDCVRWQPAKSETSREEIKRIYADLETKFPPLYEQLVLSWRWLDVEIPGVRMFANPPCATIKPLADTIFRDPVLTGHLVVNGYIPFGFDENAYDPVCFDTTKRHPDGDCPVRKFEHEAMLSFDRIGESWVLWPSCRAMMLDSAG